MCYARQMKETLPSEEARRILAIASGPLEAFQIVERQLGVLVLRTQVLLSLCGIVITVTGFSGAAIARVGIVARASITLGICTVLLSAVLAILGVLRLRWLTQSLCDDPLETLVTQIGIRNRKSEHLARALRIFTIGFTLYVAAIAQLLASA